MPPPHLPRETLDYIVDHLHDNPQALQQCSLVCKSWVPQTQKHLFAEVDFETDRELELWKRAFPNPLCCPGKYTKALYISCANLFKGADMDGWIQSFSNVCSFEVDTQREDRWFPVPLDPFHRFSPALQSLTVITVPQGLKKSLNLAFSFPLLEDLTLHTLYQDGEEPVPYAFSLMDGVTLQMPQNSPLFTGALDLSRVDIGFNYVANLLLNLPNGIHFQHIYLPWEANRECVEGGRSIVERCLTTMTILEMTFESESS
jgi:hypothetical protein